MLAGTAEAAEETLEGGEPSAAVAMLKSVGGVARSASTPVHSGCLLGIAAGQDLEPPRGRIAVRVRGGPDVDSLAVPLPRAAKDPLKQILSGLQFGKPVATADRVVVSVRYRREGEPPLGGFTTDPVLIPVLDGVNAIYRCP